jgi:hypothetical protein
MTLQIEFIPEVISLSEKVCFIKNNTCCYVRIMNLFILAALLIEISVFILLIKLPRMRIVLSVLLQIVLIVPIYAQHEIKTSGLAEVENLSEILNKEHAAIRNHIDSTIKEYNKAVEIFEAKRGAVESSAHAKAERSEEGQALISEINRLREERETVYNSSSRRIEVMKEKQEEINGKIDAGKENCESLQKRVNISEVNLKLAEAAMNLSESTYKNFGGDDNYDNYRKAAENYDSQYEEYSRLFSTLQREVNEFNSSAGQLDREYNSLNEDINNDVDVTNSTLANIDSQISSRQSELDDLKNRYFDAETLKDPSFGAQREAKLIKDFDESSYYDLVSPWYGIDFYIGKNEVYRNVTPDAATEQCGFICGKEGMLFDTLCAKIKRFENRYFYTLSRAADISVTVDSKEYPDIVFFSTCLSQEASHKDEFKYFLQLLKIDRFASCEDFFNKVLKLETLVIDAEEYPMEDLSFISYLPSLKYLDIKDSNFKSFQPLFDAGYSGWVNISGAKNFTTSDLKNVCKRLNNEYGAECIYK